MSLAATALRETLAADERGNPAEARAAFRRAWDALRVATALLQEWHAVPAREGAGRIPAGHRRMRQTGQAGGPASPSQAQQDRPHSVQVTAARLGLPDGYTWTELLVEDVRQAVQASAGLTHPSPSPAGAAAEGILQAIVQRLLAGPSGPTAEGAQLTSLLARYALARATALHTALLAPSPGALPCPQPEAPEGARVADYYRAYLYVSARAQAFSRQRASPALGMALARYQWLAAAGIEHPAVEPALRDGMSCGHAALLLNYFPDAALRERVRGEWRRLIAALIDVHPQLVAIVAREVAAAQAVAIERRLPVFTWLVELIRGSDPALADALQAVAPSLPGGAAPRPAPPPMQPAQPSPPRPQPSLAPAPSMPSMPPRREGHGSDARRDLDEHTPRAASLPDKPPAPPPAPPEPQQRVQEVPPEPPAVPSKPAQPDEPPRGESIPPPPPGIDELNRIWFHYQQGKPLRDVFFRRQRRR
jgi:hypothetical protein